MENEKQIRRKYRIGFILPKSKNDAEQPPHGDRQRITNKYKI